MLRIETGKWSLAWFLLGLVTLLGFFAFFFEQLWFGGYIEFDSFTNATVGFHVSEGKALYRDIWGSKPPGIYFLNALFISLFGVSHSSVWLAQMVSGLFLISFFYVVINLLTKDVILSWLATLLFTVMFYFSVIYEGGNLTEEYGAVWILGGWAGILWWYFRGQPFGLWLGGFGMCMAIWFKEPFLFSVIPAGIWLIIYSIRIGSAGALLRFLGGALIPVTAFLLYFISSGTLDEYVKYVYYTTTYSGYTGLPLMEKVGNSLLTLIEYFGAEIPFWPYLFLLVVPGLILARGKQRVVLTVLFATFLLELISLSLSGYAFQHYYFQIIPTFYLCTFVSLAVILDLLPAGYLELKAGILAVIIASGIYAGYYQMKGFVNHKNLVSRDMDMAVVRELEKLRTDNATLFVEDPLLSHLYVRTNMHSTAFIPVPVFHFFMVEDIYKPDRINHFVHSLKQHPPDYVVTSHITGVLTNEPKLVHWFQDNYEVIFRDTTANDTISLWITINK